MNQTRKSLPSTKNPHLIMMRSYLWNLSHLQMVLGTLMTLVGRNFIIQKRVFLVGKIDLEPMLDESGFASATEMGGFILEKVYKYLWCKNIFGIPS